MLQALAKPLIITRQVRRPLKRTRAENQLVRSVEFLARELSGAAEVLSRRLHSLGVHEVRRAYWRRAEAHLRGAGEDVTKWSRRLIEVCRGCAARLCGLFRAAQAAADRHSSRLAYGLLRTLEKELCILQTNAW